MKSLITALVILSLAICSPIFAQTYKTDYATKVVLAGGGTDITNTLTLQSIGGLTAPKTYTFPTPVAGIFHSDASGGLTLTAINLASGDVSGLLGGANGGTGVNNGTNTISLNGGNFAITGGNNVSFAGAAGGSTLTLPASGTLLSAGAAMTANGAVYATGASGIASTAGMTDGQLLIGSSAGVPALGTIGGTAGRLAVTNGHNTISLDIASTYVGQTSITTLGTIGTGTWQGTIIAPTYGGTGINTSATPTGSILYTSGAGTWTTLPAATNGQVLTQVAGVPAWVNSGATITFSPSNTNNFAGNTNNYTINSTNSVYYLQNSTAGSVNLTGLAGGASGRVIVLVNNGPQAVVLTNEDALSSPGNRFHLQGGSSIILGVDGTATLVYDANADAGPIGAWRVIANY